MVYFVLVACSKSQFPSLRVDTSPHKIRTKSNKTLKQIINKSNSTQGGTDKPRQSYQYFVIRIYNWWKRQIETFKRTRWIERDKLKHWDRWWLQFQLEEERRRDHFFEEERERIWNQGIWMPQILDGKDLDLALQIQIKGIQIGCQQIDLVIYLRTSAMKVGKKRWWKRRTYFISDAMWERRTVCFFFFFFCFIF